MDNSRKVSTNLMLGFLSELLTIVLGVLVPRFILTSYGSEVNGLLTSVTQIYSFVSLLEAGIGTATIQALYKTVGNKSKDETNSILAATNHYYHRTGILYLVAILAFSIIYPLIVETEIPTITIVLVIVFNGMGSVISYFFQAKYFLLLQAEGKNYIQTSLTMFTNIFKNVAKIFLMAYGFDVVFVQAISMVISLIQMIYVTWYIKRYYDWIDLSVKPNYEAISQSKNVMVHQISGLIYNNTDTIILTMACGLKTVSVYSMYTMLFSMIRTLLGTVSSSVQFVLGQAFNVDRDHFIKLYDVYELYYVTLVFSLYSVANFFILPFMKLYTAGVTDIDYIDSILPLLFISTYLLSCGRNAPNLAICFDCRFKETQNRAIAETVINLSVSIVAVHFWGIYGVLVGTIAALLYRSNDMIIYASRHVLRRKVWITYKRWLVNLLLFIVICIINQFIRFDLSSYGKIIFICIPYTIIMVSAFIIVASLSEPKTAKYAICLIKKKIGR